MDGVTFLRALRQRDRHKHTPVIVATSEEETSHVGEGSEEARPGRCTQKTLEALGSGASRSAGGCLAATAHFTSVSKD